MISQVLFFTVGLYGHLVPPSSLEEWIDRELPSLLEVYQHLHAHPELSHQEEETSAFMADQVRSMGYEVSEKLGDYGRPDRTGFGVVGVLRNGTGPVVLVRTDMDALPVVEKTDLAYASRVKALNASGEEVGVMHACGHDIHMTVFLGTAKALHRYRKAWQGTLVVVAQPAEETGTGAKALLKDGLYERFPRPDFALALHDHAALEAGKIGYCEGYALASVDSVDILVRGVGGHGAAPSETRDPIVLAARLVLALQTIVSREISPLDPAVVTVGSIHGGTKHNIIPESVKLQLTVRAYQETVRTKVLQAIERIARGLAQGADIPKSRAPLVQVDEEGFTPATFNHPELTRRLVKAWTETLGPEKVVRVGPRMVGEDFSRYSLEGHKIPACLFWLGAVAPSKMVQSLRKGRPLPGLHSPGFAPDPEPTLRTGIRAMTRAVLELMKKPQ
jgi:hippurate hydrolase